MPDSSSDSRVPPVWACNILLSDRDKTTGIAAMPAPGPRPSRNALLHLLPRQVDEPALAPTCLDYATSAIRLVLYLLVATRQAPEL